MKTQKIISGIIIALALLISSVNANVVLNSSNNITFNTSSTQRAIITSSGLFGIGLTNPSYTLDILGTLHLTGILWSNGIDLNNNKITNVLNPTANQDAATKAYVDTKVARSEERRVGKECRS